MRDPFKTVSIKYGGINSVAVFMRDIKGKTFNGSYRRSTPREVNRRIKVLDHGERRGGGVTRNEGREGFGTDSFHHGSRDTGPLTLVPSKESISLAPDFFLLNYSIVDHAFAYDVRRRLLKWTIDSTWELFAFYSTNFELLRTGTILGLPKESIW